MEKRPGFWKALHAERDLGSCSDIFSFGASPIKAFLHSGLSRCDYVISPMHGWWFHSHWRKPGQGWPLYRPSQDKGMHALQIEFCRGNLEGVLHLSRGQYCALLKGNGAISETQVLGSAFHPHQASFECWLCRRPGTAQLILRPQDTGQSRSRARIFILTQSYHYWCELCCFMDSSLLSKRRRSHACLFFSAVEK